MKILAVLTLLLLPFLTTGCVVAIGNKGEKPVDERVSDLEERMGVVESKLGIPPPVEEPADTDAAE